MVAKFSKVMYLIVLVLLVGVLLAGCGKPNDMEQQSEQNGSADKSGNVAVINGEPLNKDDFNRQLEQTKAATKSSRNLI